MADGTQSEKLTAEQITEHVKAGGTVEIGPDGALGLVKKAIASGVSIVVGLANDRQITFQTGFESDETDDAVNNRFDRAMRFADRLKARYEVDGLVVEIAETKKQRDTFAEILEDAQANYESSVAMRTVEREELVKIYADEIAGATKAANEKILGVQAQRKNRYDEGLEAFRKSGKMGSYDPVGSTKVDLKRCDSALEELKTFRETEENRLKEEGERRLDAFDKETARVDNERDEAIKNHETSVRRYNGALEDLEKRLNKLKAVAEG